jgi:glycosyltransferase A (GT-A) superfamily protein (DUF2064 family)
MAQTRKNDTVIAVCIQEPQEDGSAMDLGAIKGDSLRFLHQAFITDTIFNALDVKQADLRLFYINETDRCRLVKIVTQYIRGKLPGKKAEEFDRRFKTFDMEPERWGERIQKVFGYCFAEGYKNVLVVGSRTPTITTKMMKAALKMLKQSDAVFGPTPEGRYYVIGMSHEHHIDLSAYDWKSPKIYSEVADAFTQKGLSWSELEIWYCVEDMEELELMVRDINQYRFEGDRSTARETEIVMERILAKLEP